MIPVLSEFALYHLWPSFSECNDGNFCLVIDAVLLLSTDGAKKDTFIGMC